MNNRVPKCCSFLCLAALLGCSPARPPEPNFSAGNLKVEVAPVEATYSLRRHGRFTQQWPDTNTFQVHVRIVNLDRAPCAMGIMTCSYYEHWKTDNADVAVGIWGCDSNFPKWQLLSPTNVYSEELPLVVRPAANGRQLLFHLAFTPSTNSFLGVAPPGAHTLCGTYVSNEIKINVTD